MPNETAGPFTVYRNKSGIYFEHEVYGDDHACCVYLDEDGYIYDYDYCAVMPRQVGDWLHKRGYNVAWDDEYECWGTVDREEM